MYVTMIVVFLLITIRITMFGRGFGLYEHRPGISQSLASRRPQMLTNASRNQKDILQALHHLDLTRPAWLASGAQKTAEHRYMVFSTVIVIVIGPGQLRQELCTASHSLHPNSEAPLFGALPGPEPRRSCQSSPTLNKGPIK